MDHPEPSVNEDRLYSSSVGQIPYTLSLNLTATLQHRHSHHHPHFIDVKTVAQKKRSNETDSRAGIQSAPPSPQCSLCSTQTLYKKQNKTQSTIWLSPSCTAQMG